MASKATLENDVCGNVCVGVCVCVCVLRKLCAGDKVPSAAAVCAFFNASASLGIKNIRA